MLRQLAFIFIALVSFSTASFAQLRKVPAEVTSAFTKQYPTADNISYRDNLMNFQVAFTLNGEKMTAKYSVTGEWKETEKSIAVDALPKPVIEGFEKSKYVDWEKEEAVVILHPSGTQQYRIKVGKSDIQKKNLFFTKNGRMIREAITI